MSAEVSQTTVIDATLRDFYGNTVWNHAPSTTVTFTIPQEYQRYGNMSGAFTRTETFIEGKARFIVNATETPGRVRGIAQVSPALEGNSFSFESQP